MDNPLDKVEPLNMVKSTKSKHSLFKWYVFTTLLILFIL